MTRIVLPGDEIPAKWLKTAGTTQKGSKIIGPGLKVQSDCILVAVVAGILNETNTKIWVESAETKYIPRSGDYVLGTVIAQASDYHRVDIGGPQSAMLNSLSFENATKRNKPNVKVGSLIYGQVVLASKNMDPELTCVDKDGRAQGMGLIKVSGSVIQMPLNFARRLLRPNNKFIEELGKNYKFEMVVGMNGQILISGSPETVVSVQRALCDANYSLI